MFWRSKVSQQSCHLVKWASSNCLVISEESMENILVIFAYHCHMIHGYQTWLPYKEKIPHFSSKKLECIKKFSIQILNLRMSRFTCYWRGSPQSFPGCSRVVDVEPEHWHHWWRTGCGSLCQGCPHQRLSLWKTCPNTPEGQSHIHIKQ